MGHIATTRKPMMLPPGYHPRCQHHMELNASANSSPTLRPRQIGLLPGMKFTQLTVITQPMIITMRTLLMSILHQNAGSKPDQYSSSPTTLLNPYPLLMTMSTLTLRTNILKESLNRLQLFASEWRNGIWKTWRVKFRTIR
jgi:hypothetical protein